jgi:AraC-like DNA-binding protein
VFRAIYRSHTFARHAHEAHAIGVVDGGVGEFWCRGANHRAARDSLVLIQAGEAHTGRSIDAGAPLSYRMIYVSEARRAELLGGRAMPAFRSPAPVDRRVARAIRRTHDRLNDASSALERESALADLLVLIESEHGAGSRAFGEIRRQRPAVAEAHAFIAANYRDAIGLVDLARRVGLSPHHLNSSFSRAYGIPPHAFQTQLRVREGMSLLRGPKTLAMVAIELGFADQSHFTRMFRRIVGVTPGCFRASRA